jgi:hypothetical protein
VKPSNVEQLTFADGRMITETGSVETGSVAAQVYRLYDTVLDRLPDAPGLSGWAGALRGGMTLKTAADGYTGSAEF